MCNAQYGVPAHSAPRTWRRQVYEVRERELNSHASRIERHILAIAQRAHVQQEAFVRAMAEVRTTTTH